jgi:threonine dehydrogenase-like Zn-dependent dehydrogenase
MRALHWDGRELSFQTSYPLPSSKPKVEDGESAIVGATGSRPTTDSERALVKVHLAGICSTDLQIFKGYMGFKGVPGHEFVGSVTEGRSDLVGKRVVGAITSPVASAICAGTRLIATVQIVGSWGFLMRTAHWPSIFQCRWQIFMSCPRT